MPIRVMLAVTTEMGRSVFGSALAGSDDLEIVDEGGAVPPRVDVVVLEKSRVRTDSGIFARLAGMAPVGVVTVNSAGTVDSVHRVRRAEWIAASGGAGALADAIRAAAI